MIIQLQCLMHIIKYLSLISIGKMPKECFDEVFKKCGGVLHTESCGSLPRNKKQIANMRSLANTNVTSNEDERDSLYAIIEQCKQEETGCDPFVRCVQGALDAMCVLATNLQLQDLVRFCCNPNEYCILGIDPTFSLGEFSVTLTTYRHLQLIGGDTKKTSSYDRSNVDPSEKDLTVISLPFVQHGWVLS